MPRWAMSPSTGRPSSLEDEPEVLAAAARLGDVETGDLLRRGPAGRGRGGGPPGRRVKAAVAMRRPTTWSARPRRTTSTSGSSGTGAVGSGSGEVGQRSGGEAVAVALAQRLPRLWRRPAARRPSWCDRRRVPSSTPSTRTRAVKVLACSGPSSCTAYSTGPAECRAQISCRLVFQSSPAPRVAELRHERVEQVVHERAGRGKAGARVGRTDDGLDGVGEDRVLVATAGGLLAAAEQEVVAQPEGAADRRERAHVDDGGPQLGEAGPR